jgi:hypothetical protein
MKKSIMQKTKAYIAIAYAYIQARKRKYVFALSKYMSHEREILRLS